MLERRIGKFYVSKELVNSEEMIIILRELKFIPYRGECLFYRGEFEYIGYSPLFESLKIGAETPTYRIIIHTKDEELKVEAEIIK